MCKYSIAHSKILVVETASFPGFAAICPTVVRRGEKGLNRAIMHKLLDLTMLLPTGAWFWQNLVW